MMLEICQWRYSREEREFALLRLRDNISGGAMSVSAVFREQDEKVWYCVVSCPSVISNGEGVCE